MMTSCTTLAYRRQEQITDTNRRRMTRQTNPPEIRAHESQRNAASMATSRTNPAYRWQEQIADTNHRRMTRNTNPPEIVVQDNERNAASMATSCTNPPYKQQEQFADTNWRRLAREQPFFIAWQLNLILQVAHTYIISRADYYGMKNVIMGVGTFSCRVHQVPQK